MQNVSFVFQAKSSWSNLNFSQVFMSHSKLRVSDQSKVKLHWSMFESLQLTTGEKGCHLIDGTFPDSSRNDLPCANLGWNVWLCVLPSISSIKFRPQNSDGQSSNLLISFLTSTGHFNHFTLTWFILVSVLWGWKWLPRSHMSSSLNSDKHQWLGLCP